MTFKSFVTPSEDPPLYLRKFPVKCSDDWLTDWENKPALPLTADNHDCHSSTGVKLVFDPWINQGASERPDSAEGLISYFCVTSGAVCHGLSRYDANGHDGIHRGESAWIVITLTRRKTPLSSTFIGCQGVGAVSLCGGIEENPVIHQGHGNSRNLYVRGATHTLTHTHRQPCRAETSAVVNVSFPSVRLRFFFSPGCTTAKLYVL